MKKKFLTGIIAAIGLSLGITSCSDESSSISEGMGRISPKLEIDANIISARSASGSRAGGDVAVTVTDLKLKLTSDDGSFTQEWESINDFDESQNFKVGDYTLEAYYGDENDAEGFSKPHFHDSQAISVKYDLTTNVEVRPSLKNSRVFVRYTDAFKDYMAGYSAQVHTPKGKYIKLTADETSPVYVTPGTVNVNLSFTKPNGSTATIEAARFEAKAKTEHVVTIDISGGDSGADATLKVLFDDTIDTEDIEIDLSDELMDAPAPEIIIEGWTNGQSFPLIENSPAPSQIKANIIARGKIAEVMLSTSSLSLQTEGWANQIDLASADDANVALLTSLGLKTRGIWKKPDVLGVIDFTDVFPHLGIVSNEETTHQFSLQVKDKYGKLSDVYEFSVVSSAGYVELESVTAEIGLKTIIAEVHYNGSNNLADVHFQMRNLNGAFDDLTLVEAKPVPDKPGYYTAKLSSMTAIESTHTIRATFGSCRSERDLDVTTPPFELIASPNDVFAHTATIGVRCENADDAYVAQSISFTVNGKDWDYYSLNGSDIELKQLKAGTTYTIEAKSTNYSAKAEITTETEDHLPGCDHGDTDVHSVGFPTASWTGVNLGGSNSNCLQYLWSVTGWATVNELTTSQHGTGLGSAVITGGSSYKATSGTIPANGRSTQSFVNGGRVGTDKHSDGHTTGKADLHKTNQCHGSNAALIRTVGWGSGNTAHGDANIFTAAKDNNAFGTCENMTPGELYLGKYENGDAQYGYNFTSRPKSVEFNYRYTVVSNGNGDYGTAKFAVYSADGTEIAADSIKLTERSAYSPASISLTYPKGAPKAAKISIIFRSTDKYLKDNPALTTNKTYWNVPGDNNTSGGEYVGSELYIDDVKLTY